MQFGRATYSLAARERNGVLWDLSVANVIQARRIRNPCSEAATAHEAEKDPTEFLELMKALTRQGDVVLDPFCGRARWAKETLAAGRHVIAVDVDGQWLDRIAREDFGYRLDLAQPN